MIHRQKPPAAVRHAVVLTRCAARAITRRSPNDAGKYVENR